MPNVDPTHIIAYACNSQAENDTDPEGGGIDATVRVFFSGQVPQSTLSVLNNNTLDNGKVFTVKLRDRSGHKTVLPITLSGAVTVAVPENVTRLLEALGTSPFNGQVIVQADGIDIVTIPGGERGVRSMFVESFFDLASKTYYEKFFWKNADPAIDMNDPVVNRDKSTSEFPEIGFCDFALANEINDTETVANRLTGPVNIGGFGDEEKSVPGNVLPRAQCIGVWLAMHLRRKMDFKAGTFKYGTRIISQSPT